MAYIVANRAFFDSGMKKSAVTPVDYAIEHDITESVIFLVPTGRYVRKLKNSIIAGYYNKYGRPAGKLNIFTLQALATECYRKLPEEEKKTIVSDSYQMALFEEAAENAGLRFFVKKGGTLAPHVLKRLAGIINGLAEDGISPQDLNKDIDNPSNDVDIPKLSDIIRLYNSYKGLLGYKYTDNYNLFNGLNSYIGKKLFSLDFDDTGNPLDGFFNGIKFIYLLGFSEFKPPESDFIQSFAECSIPLGIEFGYSPENGPLFSHMEYNINRLTKGGLVLFEMNAGKPQDTSPDGPPSGFLRRWLFNRECEIKHSGIYKNINIYAAKDKLAEVNAICRLVKYLCISKGMKPYEICIVSRRPENYAALFREFLPMYGIPYNISQRLELSASPVVNAIFSVIDITTNGYRLKDVQKAGRSPYLTFRQVSGGNELLPDIGNLVAVASKMRISGGNRRGGKAFWAKRLGNAALYMHSRLSELYSEDDSDSLEAEYLKKELKSVRKAIADFNVLAGMIPEIKTKIAPAEFAGLIINRIIKEFNITQNIGRLYQTSSRTGDSKNSIGFVLKLEKTEQDSKALDEFIKIVKDFVNILEDRFPGRKFSAGELASKLRTTVGAQKYQVREKHRFGVTVTSVEQTRGMDYNTAILCGTIDGEFPMSYIPESFLGKELPETEKRFLQGERLQFYNFLNGNDKYFDTPEKNIFITYPKYNGTEELVRSPFIDELLKISTLGDNKCVIDLTDISIANEKNGQFSHGWINSAACLRDIHTDYSKYYKSGYKDIEAIAEQDKTGISFIKHFHSCSDSKLPNYTGNINLFEIDEINRSNLNNIKDKAFSVSELEEYARCGFRYFANYLMRLRKPEEPEEFLSSLETGNLIHSILNRFIRELQKEQALGDIAGIIRSVPGLQPLMPVKTDKEKYSQYLEKLLFIATEELEAIRFEHPFFDIEEKRILGSPIKPGMLEKWLYAELNKPANNYYPVLTELSFGIAGSGNIQNHIEIEAVDLGNGLSVKGKTDRVELMCRDGRYYLVIADYKSGLKYIPKLSDILKGKSFQMPLYLLAVKKILSEYYGLETELAGVVYYSYNPEYSEKEKSYNLSEYTFYSNDSGIEPSGKRKAGKYTQEQLNGLLEDSGNYAVEITNRIAEGIFNPLDKYTPSICQNCPYSGLCRIGNNDTL